MTFPIDVHTTARDIRRGDVFVLHGHTRTAAGPAWPSSAGHVHISFQGGGDATIPAGKPLTVTRMVGDEAA